MINYKYTSRYAENNVSKTDSKKINIFLKYIKHD